MLIAEYTHQDMELRGQENNTCAARAQKRANLIGRAGDLYAVAVIGGGLRDVTRGAGASDVLTVAHTFIWIAALRRCDRQLLVCRAGWFCCHRTLILFANWERAVKEMWLKTIFMKRMRVCECVCVSVRASVSVCVCSHHTGKLADNLLGLWGRHWVRGRREGDLTAYSSGHTL